MADKYWANAGSASDGDNDWSGANWADASGDIGTGGAAKPSAGDDVHFTTDDSNCTLSEATAAINSLVVTSDYGGTLDFNDWAVNVTGGGDMTFDGSGTVDCGASIITCSGNFDNKDQGTWTKGTSTLVMDGGEIGIEKTLTSTSSKALYAFTCSGNVNANSLIASGSAARIVSGTLNIVGGTWENSFSQGTLLITGTMSIASGQSFQLYGGALTIDGGTLTSAGTGYFILGTASVAEQSGTFDANVLSRYGCTGLASGTYGGNWTCVQESTDVNYSFVFTGNAIFTGNVSWNCNKAGRTYTIDNSGNYDLTFQGDVTVSNTAGVATDWSPGSGTITLSGTSNQSIDFNGESVEAITVNKSAGNVTMTGALTTAAFTGTSTGTGDFDPNGQTITTTGNCSWASAFTFDGIGADVMNGSDWQIGGNFTADGQTLPATANWDLDVTGTAVASGKGDVEYCTAGGTEIDASAGTWTIDENTTGWNVGGATTNRRRRLLICGGVA